MRGSATLIATEIRKQIKQATGLTASAGVSYNKFLAKMASDLDKPNGLTVITPEQGVGFIEQLSIDRFYGVGKATARRMKQLKIYTGLDLRDLSKQQLVNVFGKIGAYFYSIARGIDDRPVVNDRVRKSIGSEKTFARDLSDIDEILVHLQTLVTKVASSLSESGLQARTLTIKVKYANFEQITRSNSFVQALGAKENMVPLLLELVRRTDAGRRPIRLLGITASNLVELRQQVSQSELGLV